MGKGLLRFYAVIFILVIIFLGCVFSGCYGASMNGWHYQAIHICSWVMGTVAFIAIFVTCGILAACYEEIKRD